MDVLVWHGASRVTDPKELKKYDVVLTTYAVLESCFRKQSSGFKRKGITVKEKSPLHAVEWERIVVRGCARLSQCSLGLTYLPRASLMKLII